MASRKNKMSVDFSAMEEYAAKLEKLGGDATKQAFTSALKASQRVVKQSVVAAMQPHRKTGQTAQSAIGDKPVEWSGNIASVPVGFDLRPQEEGGGGLASVFLMYGTKLYGQPHVTPDRNLYNAVYGASVRKRCQQIQEEAFRKVLERIMK